MFELAPITQNDIEAQEFWLVDFLWRNIKQWYFRS